jgi:hypothetical protein
LFFLEGEAEPTFLRGVAVASAKELGNAPYCSFHAEGSPWILLRNSEKNYQA